VSTSAEAAARATWGFDTLLSWNRTRSGALQTTQSHHQSQTSQVMMITSNRQLSAMRQDAGCLRRRHCASSLIAGPAYSTGGRRVMAITGHFDLGFL